MTIQTAWASIRKDLWAVSDVPDMEAQRILLQVLGQEDGSWLIAHGEEAMSPADLTAMMKLTIERATGKPLAYVLGEWDFYGRTFMVDERVLVPRPETEGLVERALEWLAAHPEVRRVADVGTGSGVIAITLALELEERSPALEMVATDISPEALAVARENARRHGVLDRIDFLEGDLLEPLAGKQVDLIVSNPPYVPTAEVEAAANSPQTVGLTFEPQMALDGGADGRHYIQKITASGIPAVIEGLGGKIVTINL